jgi:hypothetical protein
MARHRVNLSLTPAETEEGKLYAAEDGATLTYWASMLVRREIRKRRKNATVTPSEPAKEPT